MKTSGYFERAFEILAIPCPHTKIDKTYTFYQDFLKGKLYIEEDFPLAPEIEGALPVTLQLVSPKHLPRRRLHSVEGRAAMLHAISHIEWNAINLAMDAIYRFRGMPEAYYADWLRVGCEEAYHFHLLEQQLQHLGYAYGDFPAHNGLWEMAQKTGYDVIARMALVPRLLEARGLDAAPDLAKRFLQANDEISSEILGIIFHDEIGHVKVGNHWYYTLCHIRGEDPLKLFIDLVKRHAPDFLKGPFEASVRRRAGFCENELEVLNQLKGSLEMP